MNLGNADATSLARRITQNDLSGYSAECHAEGRKVLALSERLVKTVTASSSTKRVMRNLILRMLPHTPILNKLFARQMLDVR